MRIDELRLTHFAGSEASQGIGVRMRSGETVGQATVALGAAPRESAEFAGAAFLCLRDWLGPAVVSHDVPSAAALQQRVQPFQGHAAAKAALDLAWWNLAAQAQRKPLAVLLGAVPAERPSVGRIFGPRESIDTLLVDLGRAFDAGLPRATLQLRPGWDVQVVRAVRQVFPSAVLAVDFDGCCTLAQRDLLYQLDDFALRYVEQPLPADDLVGHAMLQESLRTPIALHQSLASLERVEQAVELASGRLLRLDPLLLGGLTPLLAALEMCAAASAERPCVCELAGDVPAELIQAGWTLPGAAPRVDLPERAEQFIPGAVLAEATLRGGD